MGVIGLWSILDAGARPVRLEALAKKRLAVDASIWIYQFLKAVRDKEGNVLKNAHVVGFFRRICKLLFHGIQPVFVFDGKAPLLKKQTLRNRKVLREGGRIDVAKTAGKILAVQMRKRALEEAERQKTIERGAIVEEAVPENPVYFEQLELQPSEIQKQKFKKLDQYHLPELSTSLDRSGNLNDPRIMTHEELQTYAKDFEGGEDMNLYDFSSIDYDSEMFTSLPPTDQYSILNAARLRSRLRMGLSIEQLTDMFPDRMAFSRFQIERVKERSDLTNRLMNLNGMNEIGGVQRIASERGREYVLVKNENVDGGWSLGVVNSAEKPIIIDKELEQLPASADDEDEGMEFEDVPIGTNSQEPNFTGMTEDDMIKFALEESRRAQMSSTKPQGDFRPRSRRQGSVGDTATPRKDASVPLFARDESGQEAIARDELRSPVTRENFKVGSLWEAEEAEEVRNAIARPNDSGEMPVFATDSAAGGFVLEDDEEEEDFGTNYANNSTSQTPATVESEAHHVQQGRQRESLDLQSNLNGQRHDNTKPSKNVETKVAFALPEQPQSQLDKLQRAMQSAAEPEGIDVVAATDKEFTADKSEAPSAAQRRPSSPARAVPSWFEEEISRPEPLPQSVPAVSNTSSPVKQSLSGHNVVDLTMESDEEEGKAKASPVEIDDESMDEDTEMNNAHIVQPSKDVLEDQNVQNSSTDMINALDGNHQMDIVRKTSPPRALDTIEAPEQGIGSPAWSQTSSQLDLNSVQTAQPQNLDSLPRLGEVDSSPSVVEESQDIAPQQPPQLEGEDSILDEVDQARLMEEEDMMARMEAEEDEYARFSAELGSKTADNYTSTEYEQDLKALKNQQKKNLRDADEVTQIMVMECQELLAQFGIPYITAASEAESQCAKLVQLNLVDGIVTDDSDVFLFGGTRVYRNMFNTAKTVECYVLSDLEREFDLDRDKLIKLAHLLGSDYTEGIKKIGPVLALELIAEFNGPSGLDEFRDYVDRVQRGQETEEDKLSAFRKKFVKTAEKLVLPDNFPNPLVMEAYVNPEVDDDTTTFEWGQPDVDALRNFLMRSCGWRQEYTDSQLLPVIKDMNLKLREGTQRNLTDFFSGSIGAGAGGSRKAVKSTRMHNALSSLRNPGTSPVKESVSQPRKRKPAKARKKASASTVDEIYDSSEEEAKSAEEVRASKRKRRGPVDTA